MHTAEHILNGTMVRMFGCPRSRNAHIERKKSKCDYLLDACTTDEQVIQLEAAVNEVIARNLEVPGSSPGWSTLKIRELRRFRNSLFLLCEIQVKFVAKNLGYEM